MISTDPQATDPHSPGAHAPDPKDPRPEAIGLPAHVRACLFDLDGVLTDTAAVHDTAWTATFDAYLAERAERTGESYAPFDSDVDYGRYVDGKAREDGVRDFLASRGITLPDGGADDPADAETVHGIGNRKNEALLATIERQGVRVFEGSRRYLQATREAGLRRAVVSSSANTRRVLEVTGLADLVEDVVDANTVHAEHLHGKPAPDGFLAGAARLDVPASAAAVFEDALAGVQAGRAGRFGVVVGVNRLGDAHGRDLREHGADVVVTDLAELLGPGASGPAAKDQA